MTQIEINGILERQFAEFNTKYKKRYSAVFAAVRGSQNYGLETKRSDIDTLIVAIPTLREMAFGKPLSEEVFTEVGICVLKDFRSFTEEILKCNINYLEILYTPYIYYPNIDCANIKDFFEEIKPIITEMPDRVLATAMGQANNHFIAYQKKHDPHRLAAFMRCAEFIKLFIGADYDFEKALCPNGVLKTKILDIKNGTYPKELYTDSHVKFLQTDLMTTYNIWKKRYKNPSSKICKYRAAFEDYFLRIISLPY